MLCGRTGVGKGLLICCSVPVVDGSTNVKEVEAHIERSKPRWWDFHVFGDN